MAARRALVRIAGKTCELPRDDTLLGAEAGAAAVPLLVVAGAVFTVPANTQLLYNEEIEVDGEVELDGALVEVS